MNGWLLILLAILLFAPKSTTGKSGRFDLRAMALLLCIVALIAQYQ